MVDRSDKTTTGKSQKDVYFSDFMTNFKKHPNTGVLTRVLNESSVQQSLKNLLLTSRGERLFQPLLGGNVRSHLFEMVDVFSADALKEEIISTIRNDEPRIDSLEVEVLALFDQSGYTVKLRYTLKNSPRTIDAELVLTRIR